MFQSATLKLTGWYLLILMTISVLFSAAIYELSFREVNDKLEQLQTQLERRDNATVIPNPLDDTEAPHNPHYTAMRTTLLGNAQGNLVLSLFYINLLILIVGGSASYLLARRTLRHIEASHIAQSRFTSDASHELRTPLAAMRSEIEVILRDPNVSKSELRETLESNLEEVGNLSRLSQLLLDLSKAEHGAIALSSVHLDQIVETAIERLGKSGARISVDRPVTSLPPIHANATGLEELCVILLDNALKYSPKDSPITVTLKRRSYRVFIEITNQGKGISPQDAPHIFERFYRADNARTGSSTAGYGLGLALAKKITELHHGDILVKSIIDQTTTFTVVLPLDRRDFAPSQSSWWHAIKKSFTRAKDSFTRGNETGNT